MTRRKGLGQTVTLLDRQFVPWLTGTDDVPAGATVFVSIHTDPSPPDLPIVAPPGWVQALWGRRQVFARGWMPGETNDVPFESPIAVRWFCEAWAEWATPDGDS